MTDRGVPPEGFLRLASQLSGDDSAILQAVAAALDDPAAYLETHDDAAERLSDTDAPATDPRFAWLMLVDRLLAGIHAVEVDWRTRKDDLMWSLEQLGAFARLSERSRQEIGALACSGETIACLAAIAEIVAADNQRLAAMDIESDSYVLLLLDRDVYARATELAATLGCVLRDVREHDPNA